jgi:hypothetical protein
MKTLGKVLIAMCLLMHISSAFAADTIKIHLTYKHNLDKGGHSLGYLTICQKFYTPELQLFREINYDDKSGKMANYTYYFYNNGKLFTEECYNHNDSMIYILKHGYDTKGREKEVARMEPAGGKMGVSGKTVYSYDKAGKLHQKKAYFGKKVGSITTYVYDTDGNLQSENTKCKPVSKLNLKEETRSYSYNSEKKLEKVAVKSLDLTGKSNQRSEAYSYDKNGNVSTVSITGDDMPDGLVKSYEYLDSGVISLYQESNSAGICNLMLQYDYKKHFMEPGTRVSYFASGK